MSAGGLIDRMEDFRSSLEAAMEKSEAEEELAFKSQTAAAHPAAELRGMQGAAARLIKI